MQAFELYFNPKNKETLFLKSFIYEPENVYEKRLGNLYMVGELAQAMPQNAHFLDNLASLVKKEYYSSGLKKSCEESLREALKIGNDFLNKESKKGNVGWLGNLNFAVLNYKEPVLNFAKSGNMKILLARNGELVDLSQSLEEDLPNPDPLKIFGSMAAGKLSEDDKIIVINNDIFSCFSKIKGFLKELYRFLEEKDIKQLIKTNKEALAGVFGVCLFLTAVKKQGRKQTVSLKNELPVFSFSRVFIKPVKKVWKRPKINLPSFKINLPKIQKPAFFKIKLASIKKQTILVVILFALLIGFFLLFQGEKKKEIKEAEQIIAEAKEKAIMAESFLVLKEKDKAKTLFEEALTEIAPLTKRGRPLREEALLLQSSIEQELLKQ
ncbi:MAG: hypothetical protein Q8P63_00195 [Candidatus Nealsonbacteria bacterium]|nr:hypothetical protein [Candidatus Nealsonbacteria bacterium]